MGPRISGFLVGGFLAASASAALFEYDFMRKQEVTNKKLREVELQADIVAQRFRVIEAGLSALRERESIVAAANAPPQ